MPRKRTHGMRRSFSFISITQHQSPSSHRTWLVSTIAIHRMTCVCIDREHAACTLVIVSLARTRWLSYHLVWSEPVSFVRRMSLLERNEQSRSITMWNIVCTHRRPLITKKNRLPHTVWRQISHNEYLQQRRWWWLIKPYSEETLALRQRRRWEKHPITICWLLDDRWQHGLFLVRIDRRPATATHIWISRSNPSPTVDSIDDKIWSND